MNYIQHNDAASHLSLIAKCTNNWLAAQPLDTSGVPRLAHIGAIRDFKDFRKTAGYLTDRLLDDVASTLVTHFTLSRLSIILPSENRLGSWDLRKEHGTPDILKKDVSYQKGAGLTGLVLGGEIVVTENARLDRRRSGRHGERWHTTSGYDDADTKYPLAGVPIKLSRLDLHPLYGAIVCMRTGTIFSKHDVDALSTLASIVSARITSLSCWSDEVNTHAHLNLLLHSWSTSESEQDKYNALIRYASSHLPFPRILLSTVSRDGGHILGRAVHGFSVRLITDTRRLLQSANASPDTVDILSDVVLKNSHLHSVVQINDKRIEGTTAFRHHLRNPVFILPVPSASGRVIGAFLAEMPSELSGVPPNRQFSIAEIRRFHAVARTVGMLLTSTPSDSVDSRVAACADRFFTKNASMTIAERTRRHMHELLSDMCHDNNISKSVLYTHNTRKGTLSPTAVFGLAEHSLKQCHIPTTPLSPKLRLVKEAFSSKLTQNGQAHDAFPSVNAERSDLPAMAVPLKHQGITYGVVVYARESSDEYCDKVDSTAGYISRLAELSMQLQLTVANDEQSTCLRAFCSLLRSASSLSSIPGAHHDLHGHYDQNMVVMRSVLRDVMQVLDSTTVSIFLPSDAIVLENGLIPHQKRKVVFTEYDMVSSIKSDIGTRPSVDRKITSVDRKGLTSVVVRTMVGHLSKDVRSDPLFSGRSQEYCSRDVRTWMGVPLLVVLPNCSICYGILTTTRRRDSASDTSHYGIADLQLLHDVADMIAGQLSKSFSQHEASELIARTVRQFSHDLPQVLTSAIGQLDECLGSTPSRVSDHQPLSAIQETLESLSGCFQALLEINSNHDPVEALPSIADFSRVRSRVNLLLQSRRELCGNEVAYNMPSESYRLVMPEPYLIYILYLLIQNSCNSCNRVLGRSGKISVTATVLASNHVALLRDSMVTQRHTTKRFLMVDVVDDGPGLGRNNTVGSIRGGQGLEIIKGLCAITGSTISVEPIASDDSVVGVKATLVVPIIDDTPFSTNTSQ